MILQERQCFNFIIGTLTESTESLPPKATKAKPRDRPLVGSVLILTSVTSPNLEKYSLRSSEENINYIV